LRRARAAPEAEQARSIGTRKICPQTSAETGLPGRPDHRGVAEPAGHQRFSGPHGDLVESLLQPELGGHLADEVVVADRRAADGDDQVGARRPGRSAALRLSASSRAMGRSRGAGASASSSA
jgi:hypothetical protein